MPPNEIAEIKLFSLEIAIKVTGGCSTGVISNHIFEQAEIIIDWALNHSDNLIKDKASSAV